MATYTLNPKKLKVLLTSLREVISAADKSPVNLSVAYCLLLVSELASRGIGIDLPSTTNDDDGYDNGNNEAWITVLLDGIKSVAGKVAIDDANDDDGDGVSSSSSSGDYPQPMMAALNAASGMAASACVSALEGAANSSNNNSSDTLLLLPMNNKSIRESVSDTIKRCQDVDDGRFYTLLKIALDIYDDGSDASDISTEEKKLEMKQTKIQQLKQQFNTIAYSNYLYGASNFGKDQAPMWKRCLDTALLLGDTTESSNTSNTTTNYKSYQNTFTILPLQNMIRIAHSKGNDKRVKELSIFLSLGYLGGVQERLDRMKNDTDSKGVSGDGKKKDKEGKKEPKLCGKDQTVEKLLTTYFQHRSSALVELEEFSTSKTLLDLAKDSLSKCDCPTTTTSEENYEAYLIYHYIQAQIEYLSEESNIWIEVQRMYRSMLNRRPDEGGNSTSSSGGGGGVSIGIGSTTKKSSTKSASSTTNITPTNKTEMESQTRNNAYLEAWKAWNTQGNNNKVDSLSSVILRNAIISSVSPSASTVSSDIVQDCYNSLLHQVGRLVDIAVAIQKNCTTSRSTKKGDGNESKADISRAWQVVFTFVSPLLKDHLFGLVTDGSDGNSDAVLLNTTLCRLMECCSEAIITASWMCEPCTSASSGGDNELFDLTNVSQLLSMSHECLMACNKKRSMDEKRLMEQKKKETSVLSSKERLSESGKKELLEFQCALAASKCRIEFDNAAKSEALMNDISVASRRATVAATKSSTDTKSSSFTAFNAKVGTPYIQFLSAWSGMYDSPWPFCAVGQARSIVRNARESMATANKVWGRHSSLSIIEQVMLDIGEADLEGVLMGGFANVADKLYRQAMTILEENNDKLEVIARGVKAMIKVHCLLGLARLSLSGNDSCDAVVAEDLARDALKILSSVNPSDHTEQQSVVLLSIYAWNAPSLNQLSNSYHVCASRQLVADACIRSSRPEDAREFLTEAVKGER